MDGKERGESPLKLTRLDQGSRKLVLTKEGYDPWERQVEIKPLQMAEVTASLISKFGQISVTSEPPGAKVLLSGKELGVTPLATKEVAKGEQPLELRLAKYDPWQQKILIEPGKLTEHKAVLVSGMGMLTVTSEPPGAAVFIGETQLGITPYAGEAPKGKQTVTLKLPKYKDWQSQATVTLDVPAKLTAKLELAPGSIKIASDPPGATVKIDGKEVGKSPLTIEHLPGSAEVEVEVSGRQPAKQQVQVQAGLESLVNLKLEPAKAVSDPITGMEFVLVPGGCFQMGDTFGDGDPDERPVHEVCVDSFYLGKYEVTQGEYKKITGRNPSRYKNGDRYPVEMVSWSDTHEYLIKLNSQSTREYRLPTEAEWEYAARSGGKKEKYAGGDDVDALAWYDKNSGGSTHPVGGKRPNGLGLYDMSGNVREWCEDWYESGYYGKSVKNNPTGPSSGPNNVTRGGCWMYNSRETRAAYRHDVGPGFYSNILGFRLVLPVLRP